MSVAARIGLAIALIGWLLIGVAVWRLWPVIGQLADPRRTRTFYIPSGSMLPTLQVNDRVRPLDVEPTGLRPGTVIVFQGAETARVDRIVAVGGDTVMLRGGRVSVNGRLAAVRAIGGGPIMNGASTRSVEERLPGEARFHRLIDAGTSIGDDFGPARVPSGTLFVLGDNRDFSADSRFPVEQIGVGMVPLGAVVGVVDRILWGRGFHELGLPIDDARR